MLAVSSLPNGVEARPSMNLAQSSLKLFAANIASAALQFLGIAYFARELGAAPMGVFFLFQALLGMLAIPADFGLRGAVEKRISEGESPGAFLSSALALKFVPIAVIMFAILIFRPLINSYLGADIAILLAVAIIFQEVGQLSIVVLKGELRVGETAVLEVARQATWVGVGVVFISQGFGPVGLVYGLLAGLGVILVWGWYKVSVMPERPSREQTRSLFNYSKYNVVSSVGGYFYNWMDVAIIGLFLTQAHVGAYEIAWRITSVVILFSRSIASTIFPQISEWNSAGAQNKIEDLLPQIITPSLILVIPAFFGTLLLSEEILGLVFGSEYTIAALALTILMFDQVTEAVQVVFGRSLQAVNHPDLAARATIVAVGLNLVLNVVLVREFGITGAAIATMVASLVGGVLLHSYFLSKIISIRVPYRELVGCTLAAMSMVFILLGLRNVIVVNTMSGLLLSVLIGAVTYGTALLVFPSLRRRILNQSQEVFGEVPYED